MTSFQRVGGLSSTKVQTESYTSKDVVSIYNEGRPTYSEDILNSILDFYNADRGSLLKSASAASDGVVLINTALDVGCGSGQYSRILAPYCRQVIGIDPSEGQIAEGKKLTTETNIEYRLGTCTDLGVPDGSVDLITVACALHRFEDLAGFYREVDRCLRPGGVIAFFAYNILLGVVGAKEKADISVIPPAQAIVNKYFISPDYLGKYWSSIVNTLLLKYRTIEPPYADHKRLYHEKALPWSPRKAVSFVKSTEAYNNLHKADPERAKHLLDNLINELVTEINPIVLGTPEALDVTFDLAFDYFGDISRKSNHP